ncbi:MAG: hypothetical protein ACRC8A_01925 [Microcoleaceae cyanobacterium]
MKIPILNVPILGLTGFMALLVSFGDWAIAHTERHTQHQAGDQVVQGSTVKPYPTEIKEAYQKLCAQQSVEEGFTQQQATKLCSCVLSEFQARFTLDEFLKIYSKSSQSQEPPEEFVDVGLTCANQLSL